MSAEIWMLIAFFAFVMAVITVAGYTFVLRPALEAERRGSSFPAGLTLSGPAGPSTRATLARAFELVGDAIPASQAERNAVRRRLIAAGYRAPSAVPIFYGMKCAATLLVALLSSWAIGVVRDDLSWVLVGAMGAAAFGYTLPDRILRSQARSRASQIARALPDTLDLMVLCVESGQSLDQAIIDASVELRRPYPELSAELGLVNLELRAGKGRAEALRSLAERNREPELRKLANLLVQSDRFGASLGPALRVHGKYLRLRSKQRAEEAARKVGVKLLFPIFFLIFPCMLMVTAGPAILQIYTQLLPLINSSGP